MWHVTAEKKKNRTQKACTFHSRSADKHRERAEKADRSFAFTSIEHLKFIRRKIPGTKRTSVQYYYSDNHHYQQYCYGYCHFLAAYSICLKFCLFFGFGVYLPTLHLSHSTAADLIATVCQIKSTITHSMTFQGYSSIKCDCGWNRERELYADFLFTSVPKHCQKPQIRVVKAAFLRVRISQRAKWFAALIRNLMRWHKTEFQFLKINMMMSVLPDICNTNEIGSMRNKMEKDNTRNTRAPNFNNNSNKSDKIANKRMAMMKFLHCLSAFPCDEFWVRVQNCNT